MIPKKSKSNITEDYIERSKNEYVRTEQDIVFLMYDLDVNGMLEHLHKIPHAELLVSNPCIELWFLLHYQEQKEEITSEKCIQCIKFRKDTRRELCQKKRRKFLQNIESWPSKW